MLEFSLIVPVYNVENYLERCIKSILHQSYKNFELILINDGSTDSSGEICESFKKNDNRIKIINQKNMGPSVARNKGIEEANGDYILFVDSDDVIDSDYLQCLNDYIVESNEDIYFYGLIEEFTDKYERIIKIPEYRKYSKKEFGDAIAYLIENGILGYSCTKCVKSSLIKSNNIHFDRNIDLMEDLLFTIELIKKSEKLIILPIAAYHYIKYGNSGITLMNAHRENVFAIHEFVYRNLKSFLLTTNMDEKQLSEILCKESYIGVNTGIIALTRKKYTFKEIMKNLNYIKNSEIYTDLLSNKIYIKNYKTIRSKLFYFIVSINHSSILYIYYLINKLNFR